TYVITVKATDTLGNTTIVANRAIRIVTPPGGIPPSVLRLKPMKTLALRLVKRQRYVGVTVFTDVRTGLGFTGERAGVVISTLTKGGAGGSSGLHIPMPKREIKRGSYRMSVRATNADLEAVRKFRVR